MLFLSQALEEQIKSLTSQIKEQEGKVKAAAPDEKQLKDLETKVNQYRKGQNSGITHTQNISDAFYVYLSLVYMDIHEYCCIQTLTRQMGQHQKWRLKSKSKNIYYSSATKIKISAHLTSNVSVVEQIDIDGSITKDFFALNFFHHFRLCVHV